MREFKVTADKMILVGGALVQINQGVIKSADEEFCLALENAIGVEEVLDEVIQEDGKVEKQRGRPPKAK